MIYDDLIRVDFYEGSNGPTLIIDTRSAKAMRLVRWVFEMLADGEIREWRLEELEGAKLITPLSLTIRVIERYTSLASLESIGQEGGVWRFEWSLLAEECREHVATIDRMMEGSTPCHDYLDRSSADAAIIELRYLEESPID